MATVPAYSTVLWEQGSSYVPPGPILSQPVPAGFVWVVRNLTVFNGETGRGQAVPYLTFYVDGFPTFNTPIGWTVGGQTYTAADVRWTLLAGSVLSFITPAGGYQVRVSGYQLTAQ